MGRTFGIAMLFLTMCSLILTYIFLGDFLGVSITVNTVNTAGGVFRHHKTQSDKCIETNICKKHSSDFMYEYRRIDSLERNVRKGNTVPNIVHFAYFRKRRAYFRFHELLSAMALAKTMKASIYLWFDFIPFGENWDKLRTLQLDIFFIHRSFNTNSLEELVRGEAVLEFGGIGLNFDVLLVKPLHEFFSFETTMSMFSSTDISSDIIISKSQSTFLRVWYSKNMKLKPVDAVLSIRRVALTHRHLVNVVPNLIQPPREHLEKLYHGAFLEWRKSAIGIKLWYGDHNIEHSERDIKNWNTTVGELFRHITDVK